MKKLIPILFTIFVCIFSMIPIHSFAEEQVETSKQEIDQAISEYPDNDSENDSKDNNDTNPDVISHSLELPNALAILTETAFDLFVDFLCSTDSSCKYYLDSKNGSKGSVFGINLSEITDSKSTLSKGAEIIRIFAYSLVLLFFGINLVEQTIKYEIFNMKGIAKLLGRLLLSKLIIDLSTSVCMIIIKIVGYLTQSVLEKADCSLTITTDIQVEKSGYYIVGDVIDAFINWRVALMVSSILLLFLIPILILIIKLVLRSIELAVLITVSPAFFACLSSDVTREYFKKFISIFLSVALQTLFMIIPLALCMGYLTEPIKIEMSSSTSIINLLTNIMARAIVLVAMFIMMIKTPKVLTNLIK